MQDLKNKQLNLEKTVQNSTKNINQENQTLNIYNNLINELLFVLWYLPYSFFHLFIFILIYLSLKVKLLNLDVFRGYIYYAFLVSAKWQLQRGPKGTVPSPHYTFQFENPKHYSCLKPWSHEPVRCNHLSLNLPCAPTNLQTMRHSCLLKKEYSSLHVS